MFEIFKKMFLSSNQSKQDIDDSKIATESDQENIGQDLKILLPSKKGINQQLVIKTIYMTILLRLGFLIKKIMGSYMIISLMATLFLIKRYY